MRRFAIPILLLALLFCCGCQPQKDHLKLLAGEFEAEVVGSLREVDFSATQQVTKEAQDRLTTITFHEPEALSGLCLAQREGQSPTLTLGDLTLSPEAAEGFSPLLALFPAAMQLQSAELTESGRTLVIAQAGEQTIRLELLPDDTPYCCENASARVRILRFEKE